mmetsp:Transcript_33230/g.84068  ORF Transcript_33230/g.84068 Transcript_33230/m.84068 type:complete len:245 (+) Transcript_33230:1889-2623(+)
MATAAAAPSLSPPLEAGEEDTAADDWAVLALTVTSSNSWDKRRASPLTSSNSRNRAPRSSCITVESRCSSLASNSDAERWFSALRWAWAPPTRSARRRNSSLNCEASDRARWRSVSKAPWPARTTESSSACCLWWSSMPARSASISSLSACSACPRRSSALRKSLACAAAAAAVAWPPEPVLICPLSSRWLSASRSSLNLPMERSSWEALNWLSWRSISSLRQNWSRSAVEVFCSSCFTVSSIL